MGSIAKDMCGHQGATHKQKITIRWERRTCQGPSEHGCQYACVAGPDCAWRGVHRGTQGHRNDRDQHTYIMEVFSQNKLLGI